MRINLVTSQQYVPGVIRILADSGHPNKLAFKGILVRLDSPSTKPPQGADGHRIELPSDIAAKQLHTLIGMGVNYHPSLAKHDPTYKIGVIEKAWIKGNALWVSGHVWGQDFPEAEEVLTEPDMGMSMELSHVMVESKQSNVWKLRDFTFTGATFLRKGNAAYFDTEAIAAAAETGSNKIILMTETEMAIPNKNKVRAGAAKTEPSARVVADAVAAALAGPLSKLTASVDKLNSKLDASDDDEDEDGVAAGADKGEGENKPKQDAKVDAGKAKAKSDDSDDDDDDDEDDEDDMDAEGVNTPKAAPGNINPDAGEHDGESSELELTQGPVVAEALKIANATIQANATKIAKLKASKKALKTKVAALETENANLRSRNTVAAEGIAAASAEAVRKTLDSTTITLLKKADIDVDSMRASGTKMTAADVDAMFNSMSDRPSAEQRMAIKLNLRAAGVMEDSTTRPRTK